MIYFSLRYLLAHYFLCLLFLSSHHICLLRPKIDVAGKYIVEHFVKVSGLKILLSAGYDGGRVVQGVNTS